MAEWTYTNVRSLIQAAGYGTDAQSVAAQDAAISATWLELASEREWSFLLTRSTSGTLTIGSEVVPLPTDLAVPKNLVLATTTDVYPVEEVDAVTLRDHLDRDLPVVQGIPIEWAWVQQQILVWPRPITAYTARIDYVKTPDPASFDAAGEALPFRDDRFAFVLAWGAMRWLAFRQRDGQSYSVAKAEYESAKQQFQQADRRGEPMTVAEWPGWRDLNAPGRDYWWE